MSDGLVVTLEMAEERLSQRILQKNPQKLRNKENKDWKIGYKKKKNPRTYSSCGSVVQWLSHAQLFVFHGLKHARLPCPSASPRVCSLIFTETVILSKHLILCHPLLLHSIFTSMRIFSSESGLPIRWPKYWNSSFSISPSNEYSGLISLDWLVWSPCCPRDSQEFSSITIQKHQFFLTQPSLCSNSHIHPWLLEKP